MAALVVGADDPAGREVHVAPGAAAPAGAASVALPARLGSLFVCYLVFGLLTSGYLAHHLFFGCFVSFVVVLAI